MSECPNCGRILIGDTPTGEQQLLCNLKNEGGLQNDLNILPLLTEECYLKTFPEERKSQAFLEFCGEGDIEAIVDLLNDEDYGEEKDQNGRAGESIVEDDTLRRTDTLRYQDQIRSLGSGLHIAVQNQKVEAAWFLLLLASTLDISQFPKQVIRAAEQLGARREDQTGKDDIRTLQDAEGMTAAQRAAAIGGVWDEWVRSGRLRGPEPFP